MSRDTRTPGTPRGNRSYGEGWSPSLRFDAKEKQEIAEACIRIGVPAGKKTATLRDVMLAWARETLAGRGEPVSLHSVAAGVEALQQQATEVAIGLEHMRRRLTGEAVVRAQAAVDRSGGDPSRGTA